MVELEGGIIWLQTNGIDEATEAAAPCKEDKVGAASNPAACVVAVKAAKEQGDASAHGKVARQGRDGLKGHVSRIGWCGAIIYPRESRIGYFPMRLLWPIARVMNCFANATASANSWPRAM